MFKLLRVFKSKLISERNWNSADLKETIDQFMSNKNMYICCKVFLTYDMLWVLMSNLMKSPLGVIPPNIRLGEDILKTS